MEPITHFLTGAVLSRAGFNRKTALATATMTLAAEAPDIDILWELKDRVHYFAHHRGFTHSFLGLFLMSSLVVGLMYLVWLLRRRRTNIPGLPPRWGLLFLFSYIAGLTHILLDFTNNYGVRPFWPFWDKWYSWDIVFIIEPALYIILIAGLVLPFLLPRHAQGLPRGRRAAVLALVCVVILYAVRDYEHHEALRDVSQTKFGLGGDPPQTPVRFSVYPYAWTVTRWYTVAEMPAYFVNTEINSRTGVLDRGLLAFYPKPPETPATLAAKQSYLGRWYLDWAQYPLLTAVPEGEDTVVHFQDLRFVSPQFRGGRTVLSGWVELDKNLNVVGEGLGSRAQESSGK